MKKVTIIVRQPPLGSTKASEALRVAVGQTLSGNQVTVAFLDEGAWAATPLKPEVVRGHELRKHIDTLQTLGHRLVVDKDSLAERGIAQVLPGVELKDRLAVFGLISEANVVIAF